jgi:DNA-binding CsgD family transcriptional regulator
VKAIAADWSQALTVREAEIARGLARGKSRDSFAEELGISKHTVVEYTRRIYRKLGVKNRAQLSARIHTGG